MADESTTVEVDDVTMVYDNDFRALDGVSLTADEGQFITLLGPSGCGKTTLLRLIAGFLTPASGRILISGQDVTALPPEKRDTVMVFQSYALFPHMTVGDNVAFGLRQQRMGKQERNQRVEQALASVSLESQRDKRPKALSGGQQQRVALARAFAMRSGVILFDEPLSNLDAKLRERVRYELRTLQQNYGFTSIYVTHDQSEALALSDQVYLMNEGRIVQAGTPHELYTNPRTSFVAGFLGVANLFSGTTTGVVESGICEVDTPFGSLRVRCSEQPPVGEVDMCWRPEDVRIVGESEQVDNRFDLVVSTVVFLGNLTEVYGHVPNDDTVTYRLQFMRHEPIVEGTMLHLAVDPSDVRILESS